VRLQLQLLSLLSFPLSDRELPPVSALLLSLLAQQQTLSSRLKNFQLWPELQA
jgi:hypothetical protein